jgi:hypothetical protein
VLRPLPFTDYSWQISQHEIRFDEEPLVGLLATAAKFEDDSAYSRPLNAMLAQANFVTRNMREGQASPWRDYQQVLPEIGLIVSTKISNVIKLTEVGRSLLSGSLSHADLLTMQLLRYQYPNGYKSTTLDKFRQHNVAIRPALTILRGLIELRKIGIGHITVDDIIAHFLPNTSDGEWAVSINEMSTQRQKRPVSVTVKRNIAAWVRLLGKTRLFKASDGQIALKPQVTSALDHYQQLTDHLIDRPLWIPDADRENGLSWFSYFGSFREIDEQLLSLVETDTEAIEDIQEDLELVTKAGKLSMDLVGFTPLDLTLGNLPEETDELFEAYRNGRAKVSFARQEHDKLVNDIATDYERRGWRVQHDPASVDLLVEKDENQTHIIEVKTTTQKTMGKQVRTGVGQVLEYHFRYRKKHGVTAKCDIILNRPFAADDWHREFCAENKINLDCFSRGSFLHGSPG